MPRPKKDATTRKQRVAFAKRVQAVIVARYGRLYQFQQRHPDLAGRVETWTLPQRERRLTIADFDSIVVPDGLSLRSFCEATGASADWLLGLRGTDKAPEFTTVARPLPTLAADLAEYVRAELAVRIAAAPLEGFRGIQHRGPLEVAPDGGAQVLAFVVEAAERALRASYTVTTQRAQVTHALADVLTIARTMANDPDHDPRRLVSLWNGRSVIASAVPTPPDVPLAEAPPIRPVTDS
jgi:hypothetical protein